MELAKRSAAGEKDSSSGVGRLIPLIIYRRPRVKNRLTIRRLFSGHSTPVMFLNQVRTAAGVWPISPEVVSFLQSMVRKRPKTAARPGSTREVEMEVTVPIPFTVDS